MINLKKIFCFDKYSHEWLIYFIIELALLSFFVVSCYSADKLISQHQEDISLKYGLNIAIECVVVCVGIFLGLLFYNKIYLSKDMSKLQACFCGHISPFLIITGITALIATSHRINNQNQ